LKGFKLLTTIFFLISLCYLLGCQENNTNERSNMDWRVFESERFQFSVNYPAEWPAFVQGENSTETPDAGIMLDVDGDPNSRIFIFGQLGTLVIPYEPGSRSEPLDTKGGLKGDLLIHEGEDSVFLNYSIRESDLKSFNGRFLGASVTISKEQYTHLEPIICEILRSIKLLH